MFDYDKLRLAYELGDCLPDNYSVTISLNSGNIRKKDRLLCAFQDQNGIQRIDNLDDLIAKLQELTQPDKPKYKDAWYIGNRSEIKCTKVENQEGYIYCDESSRDAFGKTLYSSRASLIEAQIEYWTKLLYN